MTNGNPLRDTFCLLAQMNLDHPTDVEPLNEALQPQPTRRLPVMVILSVAFFLWLLIG